ncbi:hypothetical protein D9M68_757710 [compost metagenome]
MLENARMQATVGRRPACMAMLCAQRRVSSLTRLSGEPRPKKSRKKPVKNFARSSARALAVLSKADASAPVGLSAVFRRNGSTEEISAVFTTFLPLWRDM